METSRALTVHQQLSPAAWEMIRSVAPSIHQSHLFGVNSPDQAAAIMLKGYELGLGLTASFEFIQVVQGKPTLSPRGALAIIQQSGELETLKIEDKTDACTVYMKRRNGLEYSLTWTMKDAEKAGLVKSGGAWISYPGNMLRWRCVGFVADVVFPDVIGGMKRGDELGADLTPDGDVVQGQWRDVTPPTPAPTPEPPAPEPPFDFNALMDRFTPERIMAVSQEVCGTAMPTTDEEWRAVAGVLEEIAPTLPVAEKGSTQEDDGTAKAKGGIAAKVRTI